jgi:hypothetical protein
VEFALFGQITALDVAFVTAIVTGVIGLLSPVSTGVVARSQRKADRNARIYNDKRNAYREIAFGWYKGRELLDECSQKLARADDIRAGQLVMALEADISKLNAPEATHLTDFAVLASDKVRKVFENLVDVWNANVEPLWVIDKNQAGYAGRAKMTVDGTLNAIEGPMVNFRNAMRDDLCV